MEPQAPAPAKSTPRAVVAYLKAVRALVTRANTSRQPWIRQLGMLMRSADPTAADEAVGVGQQQGQEFRQMRSELDGLELPAVCDSCHLALTSWLDKHVAACDVMIEVGTSRDLSRLRAAQGLLGEARVDLQRFNSDCDSLVAALRRRAETARARRTARTGATRWPFGGAKTSARAT